MRRRAARDGFAGGLLQIGYSSPPVDFFDGLSAGAGAGAVATGGSSA
jgi:hypothetical protein